MVIIVIQFCHPSTETTFFLPNDCGKNPSFQKEFTNLQAQPLHKIIIINHNCMIPLFNENNMPIDAKGWVKPLKKYLLNDLKIPGVCVYPVGLGKVEIFLSGVPCDQQ